MRALAFAPPALVLCAAAAIAAAMPARADEPVSITGRALAPLAEPVIASGLERLAPAIVQHALGGDGDAGATAALVHALAGDAAATLRAAYGEPPAYILTTSDGLTAGGEVALGWLERARFHGLELVVDEAIRAHAAGGAPRPPPPAVSAADVRQAWDDSARADVVSGGERLARVAAALRQRVPALASAPAASTTLERRAVVELALARGIARLATELPPVPRTEHVLVHPEAGYYLSPDVTWRAAPAPAPSAEVVTQALAAARAGQLDVHLAARLPQHPQYARLVAAAERYATLCAAGGGWGTTPLPKNDKAAREPAVVTALQERLAREGFFEGQATGVWDAALDAALARYREQRQLKPKSLIDKDLVQSLDVPCAERLATLELNVRRWRHTAWTPAPTWVQVNLAGQEMRFYRDGALAMKQRTVVGSNKSFFNDRLQRRIYRNATPILVDEIARVIINPEWNVPPRIAREELEPEIEKNPDYLATKGFRIVTAGNGAKYYVQAPGPGNALGQIKILFPNDESVYLHDTPGRNAFKHAVRALSHGCVRVDKALDFGVELLRHDATMAGKTFDETWVRSRTFSPKSTPIELAKPIPVFLEYYTASVDEAGAVWFHPDIYGYDAETFALVASP